MKQAIRKGILPFIIAAAFPLGAAAESQNGSDGTIGWNTSSRIEVPGTPVDVAHSLDGRFAFILTEDGHVLVYGKGGVLQGKVAVGQGVAAIDIDPRGQYLYLANGEEKSFKTVAVDFTVQLDTRFSPYKGNVNAPVTIAVFSDFQ